MLQRYTRSLRSLCSRTLECRCWWKRSRTYLINVYRQMNRVIPASARTTALKCGALEPRPPSAVRKQLETLTFVILSVAPLRSSPITLMGAESKDPENACGKIAASRRSPKVPWEERPEAAWQRMRPRDLSTADSLPTVVSSYAQDDRMMI